MYANHRLSPVSNLAEQRDDPEEEADESAAASKKTKNLPPHRAVEDSVACYVAARDGQFKGMATDLSSVPVATVEEIKEHLADTKWSWTKTGASTTTLEMQAGGTLRAFDRDSQWWVTLEGANIIVVCTDVNGEGEHRLKMNAQVTSFVSQTAGEKGRLKDKSALKPKAKDGDAQTEGADKSQKVKTLSAEEEAAPKLSQKWHRATVTRSGTRTGEYEMRSYLDGELQTESMTKSAVESYPAANQRGFMLFAADKAHYEKYGLKHSARVRMALFKSR